MKVLILRELRDESARKVVLWLQNLNIPFLDIVDEDAVDLIESIEIDNYDVKIWFIYRGNKYNLCDFKVIWFRRAHFMFTLPRLRIRKDKNQKVIHSIDKHLKEELQTFNTFMYEYLKQNTLIINDPLVYNYNKLLGLIYAKKAGLKIPETLIAKQSHQVNIFKKNKDSLITKNIQDVFSYFDELDKISWNQSTK